ncbi:MAG TPA: hypothetical protein ENN29_14045 [Candidatus Hydrogenedentes bacterium]|nr:hypothetical protein [Candidatus Hydrogenedentota bacterium]
MKNKAYMAMGALNFGVVFALTLAGCARFPDTPEPRAPALPEPLALPAADTTSRTRFTVM